MLAGTLEGALSLAIVGDQHNGPTAFYDIWQFQYCEGIRGLDMSLYYRVISQKGDATCDR